MEVSIHHNQQTQSYPIKPWEGRGSTYTPKEGEPQAFASQWVRISTGNDAAITVFFDSEVDVYQFQEAVIAACAEVIDKLHAREGGDTGR